MEVYGFPITIEEDESGAFVISCPRFAGCHTYGRTEREAVENIREVIEMYLEDDIKNANS